MIRWTNSEQALAACADRGFTPAKKEITELYSLLATVERDAAKDIISALTRAGMPAARFALSTLSEARAPLRARVIEVIGRVAQQHDEATLLLALCSAVTDDEPATARKAIVMLGKLGASKRLPVEVEKALIARLTGAPATLRRAIIETLGKAGSAQALQIVAQEKSSDPEEQRLKSRATLMLKRQHERSESQIILNKPLPSPMRVAVTCRAGLGRLLATELVGIAPRLHPQFDRVELTYKGTLQMLLLARTGLDVALLVPLAPAAPAIADAGIVSRVVHALADKKLQAALRSWTKGTISFRVSWVTGGHRRGDTWRLAQLVSEKLPQIMNDPVAACWECRIDEHSAQPHIALVPRGFPDPRFTHRMADVPAASHPTIAAALALQAAPKPTDTVWDPFVGSGQELIEVARLGKVRSLYGSDMDPNALDAARANLTAAHLPQAQLQYGDARSLRVPRVSLIISNPPMGRRVARDGALLALLDDFLQNARQCLLPGGRIVWLSPAAEHTAHTAKRLGFAVERLEAVDLGGFTAELQVLHAR